MDLQLYKKKGLQFSGVTPMFNNEIVPGSPVIIFQSPTRRAALVVVLNVVLANGTPEGLNKGSILCRISVLGLAAFLLKMKMNLYRHHP